MIRVAILERLTMLATPETANEILRTSLLSCQRLFVPNAGAPLEEFVNGPLRKTTHTILGEDAADALMDDLAILVKAACAAETTADEDDDSHVRMTVRPVAEPRTVTRRADEPPPSLDDHFEPETDRTALTPTLPDLDDVAIASSHREDPRPSMDDLYEPDFRRTPVEVPSPHRQSRISTSPSIRVIFASRSEVRSLEVATALGDEVELQRVSDVFELVDLASAADDGSAVVVLIDRDATSVRTSTLAAAEGELPAHAQVVLWGDGSTSNDELPDLLRAPDSWTHLDRGMSIAEVADVVREIGRASLVPNL